MASVRPNRKTREGILSMTTRVLVNFWFLALLSGFAQGRDCIAVVPAGGGSRFWSEVEAGANQAGKELGFDIYFRGPNDEEHPEVQRAIIRVIAERHCKALVLAPSVAERAVEVAWLKKKGIPTVYIDRDPGGADVVAVVSTDNYLAGKIAGNEMAKELGNHGNVILFRVAAGVKSTDLREDGFMDGATHGGLRILDSVYLGSDVGNARLRCRQALVKYQGQINGVFTPNESTTTAVVMVVRENKLTGKILHIGFDSSGFLLAALSKGDLGGLMVQRPFDMGYQGVTLAAMASKGEKIPLHTYDTGVRYLNKESLHQFLANHPASP